MKSLVKVKVKQGTLVGCEGALPNGKPYQCFRGIPYAKPPAGELRFQPPVPLKEFATPEIKCLKEGKVSLQRDPFTGEIIGSEDCLYLNVYAPTSKIDGKPLPVMVFIHGGAYMYGSGNAILYRPLYLIQEGVIVVTLNYRLGVLGFLSLPEANVPGNMALRDQQLAMQWVQENIAHFNGDPSNVTLFGESAGSASAHLHILSQSSKKLFHKAILQSGTANMNWAIMDRPSGRALMLANLMGCKSSDPHEAMDFLRKYENAKDFLIYAPKIVEKEDLRRNMLIPLRAVVETGAADAIVKEDPLVAMNKPDSVDIPIMMGYNSAEGILFLAQSLKRLAAIDKDLGRFVPPRMTLKPNDPRRVDLEQKIRSKYFKGQTVDEEQLNALADVFGDLHFIVDCIASAEVLSRKQHKSTLFFYRFDYTGGLNIYKQFLGFNHLNGVCHADELFYLFQCDAGKEPWEEKDMTMVKRMSKLWTNFAKYSNPTPDENDPFVDCTWEPVAKVRDDEQFNLNAFIIGDKQKMLNNPDGERFAFWKDIFRTLSGTTAKL